MKIVFLLAFMLVSCVGTLEDNGKKDDSTISSPNQDFIFNGAEEGIAVSNTRLAVRFFPALGGSGNFRYQLLDEGGNILTADDGNNLVKDSDGLLHLTHAGFVSGTSNRVLVRAVDIDRDIPDTNTSYVTVALPAGDYPEFNGIQRCEAFPGANGATQLNVFWDQGKIIPDAFFGYRHNSVDSYKVYYCKKSLGTSCLFENTPDRTEVNVVNPFDTQITVAGLLPNTSYYFRTTALSVGDLGAGIDQFEEENIEFSECQTKVSSGPIVFDGITDVVIASGEDGINQATVEWAQASGGYSGYLVYYHPVIDADSIFNYLDPNMQTATILNPLERSLDLVGLDSFTHHAFAVRACANLAADPTCSSGDDGGEEEIRDMRPPVASFNGILVATNDVANPSNVFLNFVPADTSFGGIFDEYRVIISDGINDYDITDSNATNTLGDIYPSAPSDYLDLYLDGFIKSNISSTDAKLNALKPGVIYQADVQAWVSRTSPLPIQGGNITVAYGTTSTVPIPISNDDTTAPLASVMTVTPVTGTLKETEILRFMLTYNETLVITGTPRIGVDIGGVTKFANLVSNTTNTMTFEYIISAGDNDLNGIEYDTSTVSLNGGTIADLSGNNANLNFIGVQPPVDSIFVDTIPPNPPTGIVITNDWISATTVDQMASWTNPTSDFAFAEVGIGSNGSGSANTIGFTTANGTADHTFFGLNTAGLIECNIEYQVMVRSVDAAGLSSTTAASPQTFKFDQTAPTATTVTLVGTTSDIFEANEVSWASTTDICGPISHYEIAIGYDDDGGDGFGSDDLNNVLDWSEVPGGSGTVSYQARSGVDSIPPFTLNASEDFYVSIRAVDQAGNQAAPASSGAFIVDIAGPSTPTNLAITTNWVTGTLPIVSPLVSWINPGEPDFDHIDIALGSTIGQEDIAPLLNIGTFTSYSWPSLNTGIVACNRNYPKVIAYDTVGNPSVAATDPNVWFAWDDVAPTFNGGDTIDIAAGGEALPGTAPIANWISTTRTDNCNTIAKYEIAIGFDDDGGDGFDAGDVGNLLDFTEVPGGNAVTQYQIVDGVDGFSLGFVGNIDYFISLRIVDEAGNTSTEINSASPFSFVIPPDQISVVEPAEIGVNEIELGWVEPNDNGTAISDYIIEYKETSSGTWITFGDPISNDTRATVTGLLENTEYDFRITAFNGSFSVPSPQVTEKTFPNHPFFNGSQNAALNLGGATDSQIVALENGTAIEVNSASVTTLNKGDVYRLTTSQNDIMTSTKNFFVAGRLGSGGAVNKGNIVWNVAAWAGREFLFNGARYESHIYTVFSFEDGNTIDVYRDGTLDSTVTINEDDFHTFTFPLNGSYHVISSGVITGYVYSSGAGGTNVVDSYPVMPLSKDIIGYQSSSGQYNVVIDNTPYTEYQSNTNVGGEATGTFGNDDYTTLTGGGSLYTGEVSRVIGLNKMTARSYADSNGGNTASHIPMTKMRKNYAINSDIDYIAFGSDKPAVITYREPGGSDQTLTLTRTGDNPLAPYKGRLTNLAEGTYFESPDRYGAWYQPSDDIGSSDQDETVMFGYD